MAIADADIVELPEVFLWRVHRTIGPQVRAWNELRYWGPAPTMRFDPHLLPARTQHRGVTYTGLRVVDAIAEVFQQTRVINRARGAPYLTGWRPCRPLSLLDLTGDWPLRSGASYTINTGRKDHCREWARAIHTVRTDLDGLWHHSSLTGGTLVTLFTHGADSFPARPSFGAPLLHPDLRIHLLDVAEQIGFRLV